MVGLVGGFSSAMLFLAFAYTSAFRLLLYALVLVVGILVGLEIPLLMRILRDRFEFKDVVANVLTFDYLGALGASLLFPIVLVPQLGLVRVADAVRRDQRRRRALDDGRAAQGAGARAGACRSPASPRWRCSAPGMLWANDILELGEGNLYADDVVLARTTPYQRIVLTAWKDDLRLFLNSNLQFSSRDEYRYHEALVHPGLAALPAARRVLILGGGDGLALREVLRYPSVRIGDAGRSRSGDDAALLDASRSAAAESRSVRRSAGARGERGCVRLDRPAGSAVRLRDRRLSRPVELLPRAREDAERR